MSTLDNAPRILAAKIAESLFINGHGQKADRLKLMVKLSNGKEIDGGGLCKTAVIDLIAQILKDEN